LHKEPPFEQPIGYRACAQKTAKIIALPFFFDFREEHTICIHANCRKYREA